MSVKRFTGLLETRDKWILMVANATILKENLSYTSKLQSWRDSLACMMPDSKDGWLALKTALHLDRFQMDLTFAMAMEAKPHGASREELDSYWLEAHDSAVKYGRIAAQYADLLASFEKAEIASAKERPEEKPTVKMGKVDKPIIYN